ncbi:MAG: ABC transporter substrate-binding protein [Gammaproteobacteria bacterium]
MTPIHIMVLRHSAFYSPLISTITGGFLREEGLSPTYTVAPARDSVAEGIAAGTVHVAQSAVATSFPALERGETPGFVHFAQINERDGFFLAGREPEPDFSWDRLVGRRVLVDHFFQPLAMFKYACHRKGVDFQAIEAIDAGDVSAIDAAFRAGQGDYVHQQGPAPQQLEREGIGHVVASVGKAIGPVAFSSLCAAPQWLETEMARAFMRAYRRAREYVIEAPAGEIAEAEAEYYPGIDRDVLTETIRVYQRLGCWAPDPAISREAYETLLDVFEHSGLITRRHPYEAAIVAPPEDP